MVKGGDDDVDGGFGGFTQKIEFELEELKNQITENDNKKRAKKSKKQSYSTN